jgi:hypothetical protein
MSFLTAVVAELRLSASGGRVSEITAGGVIGLTVGGGKLLAR